MKTLVIGYKTLKSVFHLLAVTVSPGGCVRSTVQNNDRVVCFHVHLRTEAAPHCCAVLSLDICSRKETTSTHLCDMTRSLEANTIPYTACKLTKCGTEISCEQMLRMDFSM